MIKEHPDRPQGVARKAVIDSALQVEVCDMSATMMHVGQLYNALDERPMVIEASLAEADATRPGPTVGVRRHRTSKLHKVSVGIHDSAARPILTTACGWRYGGVPHSHHRAAGRRPGHRAVGSIPLLQVLPRGQDPSRRHKSPVG